MVVQLTDGLGNRQGRDDPTAIVVEKGATCKINTTENCRASLQQRIKHIASAADTVALAFAIGKESVAAGDTSFRVASATHFGDRFI